MIQLSTPPTLADILNQVLNAIQTILYEIAKAVSDNATVIASAIVIGSVVYGIWRLGSRYLTGITRWLRFW